MRLHLPTVGLVSARKVRGRISVTLHSPQHPVKNGLAKPSTIGIAQGTAVANRNVALPRWDASGKVLEVAFTLGIESQYIVCMEKE